MVEFQWSPLERRLVLRGELEFYPCRVGLPPFYL